VAPLLGGPGARGPRFIEPPEPPVPTPLIEGQTKCSSKDASVILTRLKALKLTAVLFRCRVPPFPVTALCGFHRGGRLILPRLIVAREIMADQSKRKSKWICGLRNHLTVENYHGPSQVMHWCFRS